MSALVMSSHAVRSDSGQELKICCLACGAARVAWDDYSGATGECPYCGYTGWAYSSDLDGRTRQMIMSGRIPRRASRVELVRDRARAAGIAA